MGFKTFMSVWLILVVGTSSLIYFAVKSRSENSGVAGSVPAHFSVVWKGFLPTYSNQTPDYYICINNLQSNVLKMYVAFQITNWENSSYYFKIDKYGTPPAGWNITPYFIGLVNVDQNLTFTYSNLARDKPSSIPEGRITEAVPLVVQAYYDSAYTTLYSEANFTVNFHFIDLEASVWTILDYDDFDDGTSQGWGGTYCGIDWYNIYRSWPCSFRNGYYSYSHQPISKTFVTTGPGSEAYLIFALNHPGLISININGVKTFECDAPSNGTRAWRQYTIPLQVGANPTVQINSPGDYMYLDNVYLIVK